MTLIEEGILESLEPEDLFNLEVMHRLERDKEMCVDGDYLITAKSLSYRMPG